MKTCKTKLRCKLVVPYVIHTAKLKLLVIISQRNNDTTYKKEQTFFFFISLGKNNITRKVSSSSKWRSGDAWFACYCFCTYPARFVKTFFYYMFWEMFISLYISANERLYCIRKLFNIYEQNQFMI